MKHDISNTDDVRLLVDTFYTAIRQDALLAPVFAQRIAADKWPIHLEKMYRFWGTLLIQTQNYNGSPFDKHIGLGIDSTHFEQWVALFGKTVDGLFEGEVATLAKERANNIGMIFSHKLASMK